MYYHWNVSPHITDPQFVRMVWCWSDYHLEQFVPEIIVAAQTDAAMGVTRTWLIGNEPDDTRAIEPDGQCGTYPMTGDPFDPGNTAPRVWEAPVDSAYRVAKLAELIKSYDNNAKVFAPGLLRLNDPVTRDWWDKFVWELKRLNTIDILDGMHVHLYPRWSTGACDGWCTDELIALGEEWYTDYHAGLDLQDFPLWITETGGAPFCSQYGQYEPQAWVDIRDNVMQPFQNWFIASEYNAAFWFVSYWGGEGEQYSCSFLTDGRTLPAEITPLGQQWQVPLVRLVQE